MFFVLLSVKNGGAERWRSERWYVVLVGLVLDMPLTAAVLCPCFLCSVVSKHTVFHYFSRDFLQSKSHEANDLLDCNTVNCSNTFYSWHNFLFLSFFLLLNVHIKK